MSQSILRFSKVKASFNGESRRFDLVNLHEGASAFAKLSLYCTHVFGVGLFAIKYTDEDGDLITISSDEELSEGLSWAQGVGKTCLSLVLVATPSPKAQKKDVVQARPCKSFLVEVRGKELPVAIDEDAKDFFQAILAEVNCVTTPPSSCFSFSSSSMPAELPLQAPLVSFLKYVDDDGDLVSVRSDEELRDAFTCFPNGPVKLRAF